LLLKAFLTKKSKAREEKDTYISSSLLKLLNWSRKRVVIGSKLVQVYVSSLWF
jgi:hypothetical protein